MTARVGLVLGAGGVTGGAFHAGVLAALHDSLGWDARSADIVVGTSAGSLAGAVLRAGLAPADLLARSVGDPLSAEGLRVMRGMAAPASGFPLRPDARAGAAAAGGVGPRTAPVPLSRASAASVVRMAMRPWDVRPAAIVAALLPPGRVSTSMITGGIEPLFGTSWPAAPLWVCAVRLSDGRRVAFGRDDAGTRPAVGEAVAASCAIPGYFEPVTINGIAHVDGGAHSPTNLDLLGGLGLDLVVVSSPMSMAGRSFPRARTGTDWAVRSWCRANLDREAVGVRRRGTPVIAFQPTVEDAAVMGRNSMDPSRRNAVAERTFSSTKKRLERADVRAKLAVLG